MVQLTERDEAMLKWLGVVQMAEIDAIRWALVGVQGGEADQPVSIRRANQWVARLAEMGLVDRVRPVYRDRQIVWPTHKATGQSPPRLYRQTMRHELAVAGVSARYLARGYTWTRDRRSESQRDHQGDGIARKGDIVELIEVELTAKQLARYSFILLRHGERLEKGTANRIVYFCTDAVARLISQQANKFIMPAIRPRLVTHPVFDGQGRWVAEPR
jgi:hypothetical protein